MLGPAKQDSAIMDELAHIPAGYSYIKFFDYRLNPEHPPLVKALSALPLLFIKPLNFPANQDKWQNQTNAEWEIGREFLYSSGNDADKIIFYSRLVPIFLLLGLIAFAYFWSNELMGKWWALLPACLIAFSPNFLAHGHYVTTDIGACLGILLASYYFIKNIEEPSKKNMIYSGLALGFALLLKFSTILLIPFFAFLTMILFLEKAIREIKSPVIENKFKKIIRYFINDIIKLFFVFFIGILTVYAVYTVFTFNYPADKQYSDTASILQSLNNNVMTEDILEMSQNKILRPLSEYLLGIIMVINRSAEGSLNYFLGQLSNHGNAFYFPIIYLMKEALPILIIILTALILSSWNIIKTISKGGKNIKNKFFEYFTTNFTELSMLIFIAGYWLISINSNLNIGFRHILPALPFAYILSAQAIKKIFYAAPSQNIAENLGEILIDKINKTINLSIKFAILSGLLLWLILGTLNTKPYYLSRFNEFFGGTFNGYEYATDSNFDWGQDLKRLREFLNTPIYNSNGQIENIDKIAVDYFGGGDVNYYLKDRGATWNSSLGSPLDSDGIRWLAISNYKLLNAVSKKDNDFERNPQDEYLWLTNPLSPDYIAGTSIFIYDLSKR